MARCIGYQDGMARCIGYQNGMARCIGYFGVSYMLYIIMFVIDETSFKYNKQCDTVYTVQLQLNTCVMLHN